MNSELPSRTSIWAAAARAVGATSPPPYTNPDSLAPKLIGSEELDLIGAHPLVTALRVGDAESRGAFEVRGAVFTLLIRTRFIDEKLEQALAAGVKQLVIMGAGFDTRAYRLREALAGIRVFEVDRPSTQQWKRRRVLESIGTPPSNLTYAPIDFRHETLADVLPKVGYDASLPTLFIWEGVTMYLPATAVRSTLSWVAQQAPGSSIVLDFTGEKVIEMIAKGTGETDIEEAFLERNRKIAAWGEPWIFGIPDDGAEEYFASCGLKVREVLPFTSAEAMRRYVPIPDPQRPLPVRPWYYLAEALVERP